MPSTNFTPATNAFSRVFLIERRARPDHTPAYQSTFAGGAVEQAFGDIEKIELPSQSRYGEFDEIGVIRGAQERATTSLTGRYAGDLASEMLRLARLKCSMDVQFHFGTCADPTAFNTFSKAVILEDASITNVSTDELGTLESGSQAAVNETADLSAKDWYEVLQLTFAERAGDVITNEIVDVAVCDIAGCGDCEDESDGCQKIYAISSAAGGSAGTPPDLVYSLDGGTTWLAHDIDTLSASEDPTGVACVGDYIVVVSDDSNSLHYVAKSAVKTTGDPVWAEVTTGFVVGGQPLDIWSVGSKAFIVGNGGYIYSTEDPTAGVTVLDAGVAVIDNLNAVHALGKEFAVAVGNSGAIVKTLNGTVWTAVTPRPVGYGVHLTSVWALSETVWLIGTNDGRLLYTVDGGVSFTTKSFSGSGTGVVRDIAFATPSVGYISHSTTAPAGRILRTYSGGNSWVVLPEGLGSIPANDRVTALAVCVDANFVVGVGLADNGSDGYIVVAQD